MSTVAVLLSVAMGGEQHTESFDGPTPTWKAEFRSSEVRQLSQRRHPTLKVAGERSENVEFQAVVNEATLKLEHTVPPSLVLKDELHLSLWLRSNRPGATLALRLVFPHEVDPETGRALTAYLPGDKYTSRDTWQQLHCRTTAKALSDRIKLLRASLKRSLDDRDLYVDRAVVVTQLAAGVTEFFLDELQLGPLVELTGNAAVVPVDHSATVTDSPVEFRLDRLLVEGKPFFPRMIPYHGEEPEQLTEAGLNVVWVRDYQDTDITARLRAQGLWLMATPPRAVGGDGTVLEADDASLMPFARDTKSVLFWNLGTRVGMAAKQDLISWSKQVRAADRQLRRPLTADLADSERVLSQHLDLVGLSRHVLHTSFSFRDYRDWLSQRIKLARPGASIWTWVQTEPSTALDAFRESVSGSPAVIEPEQIRLQVYAALSVGCRGIGYWTTMPLNSDAPGARERLLAMRQLHLELELLEPLLATGNVIAQVPFTIKTRGGGTAAQPRVGVGSSKAARQQRTAIFQTREAQAQADQRHSRELIATVIQSEMGWLLLPIWLEEHAQFVPGRMAAQEATIVVEGVPESAAAWEISTTELRHLDSKRVTGGLQITVPKFDQTAAIFLTTDLSLQHSFSERIRAVQNESARIAVALAEEKLQRVRRVDQQLQELGLTQPDGPRLIGDATLRVNEATEALNRGNSPAARQLSGEAMQGLRILQRAHWDNAVRNLSSPVSSPYAVCFQTLPDHWRMVGRLGRSQSPIDANLLPSGDFEEPETVVSGGWRHEQEANDGVRADCWLDPTAHSGSYSLRLVAVPAAGQPPPAVVSRHPVTITTPPMSVEAGQLVHISGWLRIPRPIAANPDGVLIYDNLLGPSAALRRQETQGWQQFEFLREVPQTSELTITITLTGLGDVQIDDLRVIPHDPAPAVLAEEAPIVPAVPPPAPLTLRPGDRVASPVRR